MFNIIYLYKNPGSRLTLFILLSVLFFYTYSAAAQELIIIDCTTNEPIGDVIVYKNKRFMGISNQAGIVRFKDSTENQTFHFKKLGAIDTVIVFPSYQTTVCLRQKANELPIITVEGKQIPLHKQFEMFINKNKEFLSQVTDSLFYNFISAGMIPDTGLKYEMKGIVMIPLKSPLKSKYSGQWKSCYCSLHIKVDSSILNTSILKDILNNETTYFFSYDALRKGIYLKKMKEGMVVDKIVYDDSTQFIFKDYGFSKKHLLYSLPMFNNDSILIRDSYYYEQYDKNHLNSDVHKLNKKDATLEYVLNENLHLHHLKVSTTFSWEFELQLLDKKPDECAYISIFNLVRNNEIIDHPAVRIEILRE